MNMFIELLLGKSVWIQERLKTQSAEESSSSGCFNPWVVFSSRGLVPARENIWGKRRVLEPLEIQQRRPMMNLDAGLLLDRSWTPYVHPRSGSHETGSVLAGSPNPI